MLSTNCVSIIITTFYFFFFFKNIKSYFINHSVPKVTTITQADVETPTPVPNNVKLITTETTFTSFFAGYSTTNSLGDPTFIPPSTRYVVQSVAVTEPALKTVIS